MPVASQLCGKELLHRFAKVTGRMAYKRVYLQLLKLLHSCKNLVTLIYFMYKVLNRISTTQFHFLKRSTWNSNDNTFRTSTDKGHHMLMVLLSQQVQTPCDLLYHYIFPIFSDIYFKLTILCFQTDKTVAFFNVQAGKMGRQRELLLLTIFAIVFVAVTASKQNETGMSNSADILNH